MKLLGWAIIGFGVLDLFGKAPVISPGSMVYGEPTFQLGGFDFSVYSVAVDSGIIAAGAFLLKSA